MHHVDIVNLAEEHSLTARDDGSKEMRWIEDCVDRSTDYLE
jgi:hypothetical protein